MRCKRCGKQNVEAAVFCAECGARLKRRREPTFYKAFIMLSVGVFGCLVLAGFGLLALIVTGIVRNENAEPPAAVRSTAEPVMISTDAPAAEAVSSPSDDLEPIKALVRFIGTGERGDLELAVPKSCVDHMLGSMAVLLSDDAAARIVHAELTERLRSDFGEFDSVRFALIERRELSENDLSSLAERLDACGITDRPEQARELTLELQLFYAGSVKTKRVCVTVFLCGNRWYADPEAI